MKKLCLLAVVIFLPCFVLIANSGAELYQYKDQDGNIVITDKKPNSKSKVTTFKDTGTKTPEDAQAQAKTGNAETAAPQQSAADQEKEKAAEAQKKRNEEADKLEAEANQTEPFSKEQQIEQREKLERARNLRKGIDQPSDSAGR
jgi:hypothetical protein